METTESSFAMGESLFSNNVAYSEGGCIYAYAAVNYEASIRIVNCTFTNNSSFRGSVMEVFGSFVTIENSTLVHNLASKEATILAYASPITINGGFFAHNRASRAGVVSSVSSNATSHIVGSTFLNNSAPYGGVFSTNESPLNVTMCTFARNAALYGGVLQTLRTLVVITRSVFIENVGYFSGGVMYVLMNSSITILRSSFTNNLVSVCKITANDSFNPTNNTLPTGGVLTSSESIINIVSSTFTNNCAPRGGVMEVAKYSHVNIINSTFDENSASQGAVMATDLSTITINQSTLYNNSADVYGGVIVTLESKFDIVNSEFSKNSGKYGGVLFGGTDLILSIINSTFTDNYAESIGLVDIGDSLLRIDNSAFYNNIGSIYAFLCNVTISGYTKFEYCIEPHFKKLYLVDATTHQGGAITAYRSTLVFTGISSFVHNQASYGGAIVATESTLVMYGETVIAHNVGIDDSGGGIYLHQSNVDVYGNCNISQNFAFRGGGIHASSSTISVHQPGTLLFTNNSADLGGAVYFEESPKLNVLKHYNTPETLVAFAGNHAVYGGAVFVADDQRSSACSLDVECFVQTLALTQFPSVIPISTLNIIFSDNSADVDGSNLFGGQLDRCVSSPFAEIYLKQQLGVRYDGVSYLGMISNIMSDSIASTPTRVCFCTIEGVVDCDLELDLIRVTKGEKFPVSIAAVDQVNHPIGATIISLLSSSSILSEGQQSQHVNASCTDITFNVFSQDSSDVVTLFADGPCGSSAFSTRNFSIEFLDCTCLIGFQPSESTLTDCECICDPSLFPYITTCNYSSHSLLRTDTNSWITFTNDTYPPGYIIHSNCPFDYCHPPFLNISFDLNLASGSDAQCAYNRTGLLCGECGQNLSVSLGSSLCLECPRHWYAIFLGVIAASILAGVLLVAVVLALNLTVATGLVAGFIFYANIVAVNVRLNVFFSSSAMKFATVFVAWLNLEIGFDVCFFDGLDTYAKTWLELVFPVYIITLVLLIILMSRHSPRFTRLIGRRDPVSTLATLILLSYAKMLSVTIDVLSYAVLDYPDGSQDIVWLPDASVKYCQGKHIGLFVAALLIVMIGIPYTFLLFSWQWLVKSPKWSCLKWTRNTKLNFFITTHHTPYNSRHRYWTGLTLLIRVILYITAATTESSNPKVVPLLAVFLVGGLVFVKGIFGMRIYVNLFADIVDTIINFNIIVLAVFSLYDLNAAASEIAAVYTSTIITLILFLVIVIHQAYRYLRVKKCGRYSLEVNEYSEALQERIRRSEITYSVIDAPVHLSSAAEDNDNLQLKLIEGEVEGYADDY